MVPLDLPGVPRVPTSGPDHGIFSKLIRPGPLGSGGHSHTSFTNGRFLALETSFHIDVTEFWQLLIRSSQQNQSTTKQEVHQICPFQISSNLLSFGIRSDVNGYLRQLSEAHATVDSIQIFLTAEDFIMAQTQCSVFVLYKFQFSVCWLADLP